MGGVVAVYHSLIGSTEDRTGRSGERLRFQHRSSDSRLIERAWASWSLNTTTMMLVARAHWDFVFWEGPDGRHAGIQGPESRASEAPVPAQVEFVGVRLALGVLLPELAPSRLVDRFVARATERTRQRHRLNTIGLTQRTVRQIARAQNAAVRLQSGERPAAVAQDAASSSAISRASGSDRANRSSFATTNVSPPRTRSWL